MFFKQKCGWFGNQLSKNIKELKEGNLSVIPWIFCVFAENHNASKLLAARCLHAALSNFSYENIIRVDESMRRSTSIEWNMDWRKFNINDFFTPQMNTSECRAVTIFSSFNPNGFIRERAISMMKDIDCTLPYIILRQNDWVKQVRQVAVDALKYRLNNLCEGEVLTALPFADKLRRSSRNSHLESLELFFASLTAPENKNELKNGLKSSNIRTRRICIDAVFRNINPNYQLIFDRLTSESDPFLRSSIFKKLISLGRKFDWSIEAFLKDKYPVNRILAFQYLLNVKSTDIDSIAEKLLLDKNATVREMAKRYIKEKMPNFDFRIFYIENLKGSTVSAILGIGENGTQEDAAVIEKYLNDNQTKVVKSAMVSLMRLNREKYSEIITELLNDYRLGIVKTAYNLIIKNDRPNYDRIEEIFYVSKIISTKSKCMKILLTASKWQRLIYILKIICGKDKIMQTEAEGYLNLWFERFNRSFIMPDKNQIAKIKELISLSKGILRTNIENELLFMLPN